MNVKSIERKGNEATVVVEIDKELMESGVNKAYMKARKSIQLPGFRKGKAPRKMIEAMYGAHVFYEDGLEEIFPEIYDFAIAKQDFKAIGRPNLTDMQIGDDNIVTLTLTTEVYPEVTLGQYKGLEVEKEEVNVTDEQVQAELDRMAQNVASTETVERPAKMGDTANIDFEGFDNGVPFEGGKGDNFDLKLGSGQFVPGFEEQIVGMSAGEEKDIDITFPEDYHKELAGKAVVFHVKLNKVTETMVPEQDDEFAKDVSEFDTLDELKDSIRNNIKTNLDKQAEQKVENDLMDQVISNMKADIPDAMVDSRIDELVQDFEYRISQQGLKLADYLKYMGMNIEQFRAQFKEQADKQVKMRLAMEAIVAKEGITASDEEFEEEVKRIADAYKMEADKVKSIVDAAAVKADLAINKAIDFVKEKANVVPAEPKEEEKQD